MTGNDIIQLRLHLERTALALYDAIYAYQKATGAGAPDAWAKADNEAFGYLQEGAPLLPEGSTVEPLPPIDPLPGPFTVKDHPWGTAYVIFKPDQTTVGEVYVDDQAPDEARAQAEATARLWANSPDLYRAAYALLRCNDNLTTLDFARAGDHDEREALRAVLARILGKPTEKVF
jgi:hypothetical protein